MRPKPFNIQFETVHQIVCLMVSDCIEIGHRLLTKSPCACDSFTGRAMLNASLHACWRCVSIEHVLVFSI